VRLVPVVRLLPAVARLLPAVALDVRGGRAVCGRDNAHGGGGMRTGGGLSCGNGLGRRLMGDRTVHCGRDPGPQHHRGSRPGGDHGRAGTNPGRDGIRGQDALQDATTSERDCEWKRDKTQTKRDSANLPYIGTYAGWSSLGNPTPGPRVKEPRY